MPKFIQSKLLNPKLDYGYQLYITSIPELIDYFQKAKSIEFQKALDDVIQTQLIKGIEGHNITDIGQILNAKAQTICDNGNPNNLSLLDVTINLSSYLFQTMAKIIIEHGNILISVLGGYNFASPGHIETYGKIIERDEYLWPSEKPLVEIKQWPRGRHWYAYVNRQEVGDKYDSYHQAKNAVNKFLEKEKSK